MSTTKEAREALEKLASIGASSGDATQVSIGWLEGVGEYCKQAGLDPDRILDAIDPGILKDANYGMDGKKNYGKKSYGKRYKNKMDKMKKKSQASREELAAGAMKNVKKETPKHPQLDRGAAKAVKTLSK